MHTPRRHRRIATHERLHLLHRSSLTNGDAESTLVSVQGPSRQHHHPSVRMLL